MGSLIGHELLFALRAALGSCDAQLGWCAIGGASIDDLHPSELALVAGSVPKRAIELAAGRMAARAALRRLGEPEPPIGADVCGAPKWPPGIVGSITHTGTLALAVVAHRRDVLALGIDAEPLRAIDQPALAIVASKAERRHLDAMRDPQRAALALFCAKEAAYKAQYPLSGCELGFDALSIAFRDSSAQCFGARFERTVPPFRRGQELVGTVAFASDHALAVARVDPRRSRGP